MTRITPEHSDGAIKALSVSMYFILGAIALGVGFVVFAGVAFLSSLGDITIGRKPLKPIPVASTSCPYLRPVHDAAQPAGSAFLRALNGSTDPQAWAAEKAQHAQQLLVLDLTLRAAIPHVPPRVATQLEQVLANVTAGRKELAAARSASDYVSRSAGQVFDGNDALANASDLVGSACGFKLTPDVFALTAGPVEV